MHDGRILTLLPAESVEAREIVDAEGFVMAPGFIDMHSHSDWCLLIDPGSESRISQGVTTEVMGKCGYSAAPIGDVWLTWWFTPQDEANDFGSAHGFGGAMRMERARAVLARLGIEVDWRDYGTYLERLEAARPAVNVVPGVGHNTIRTLVLGVEARQPDAGELDAMARLVREAMEAGAYGLSTGLVYHPGRHATTEEIVHLCRVVAEYDGFYYTHLRNEAAGLAEAVQEAIEIAARAGVRAEIAHLKVMGRPNWGRVHSALERIDAARAAGQPVGFDIYPYEVPGIVQSSLGAVLPPSLRELPRAEVRQRLRTADQRRSAARELRDWYESVEADAALASLSSLHMAGGPGGVVFTRGAGGGDGEHVGRTFAEIAAARGGDPFACMIDVHAENDGHGSCAFRLMSEDDIRTLLAYQGTTIGSDGHVGLRQVLPADRLPHPRNYGTFPRILRRYALEDGLFSLEEAIHRMTGKAAQHMGLDRRGLISDGYWADFVLLDEARLADSATYTDPYAFAQGIRRVYVNGQEAWRDGRATGLCAGRVLRRKT